ncbi:YcnI family copper-binding membrane protein [Agromyces indicus]|uniref:YcnI family protein n=1 Tax=Agromyces indicus TaxID=758919 RepID=A0ABU1FGM3_9MICO|nr:YcnI family protein [Agromyces indicus]MDR5690566.1 YcnI family protein [Agromyces indicus]
MRTHTLRRAGIGLVAGTFLALAAPLAASAHVGIEPAQAEPGEPATFTFTALNESETASTIQLEVELPTDTPILSVRYAPLPGWTIEVVESELPDTVEAEEDEAPSRMVLTADEGNGLRPGQFLEWTVSFGPIPDTGQISFPTTQTYDDGEVVEWAATPDEVEEDDSLLPAPTLFINDDPNGHGHGETAEAGTDDHGEDTHAVTTAQPADGPSPVVSFVLSLIAAVAAVIALVVTLVRTRKAE